jgi:uncharacterized membrane protein
MQLSPLIAIHMTAALGALATGPVALWARKGRVQRPRLHRAFGYAWVTLMLATAISAIFLSGDKLPHIAGFGPIHVLIPVTLGMLVRSFWYLAHGNIAGHRKSMQLLYIGACITAGAFTLLPGRFLGHLVWGEWLGLIASLVNPVTSQGASMSPMLSQIAANTPLWVWGLLAGLLALGFSQVRDRTASLVRITVMPVAMTGLSLWGTATAFGASPLFGYTMLAWMFATAVALAVVIPRPVAAGTSYDPATRSFALPGSWVPMLLILGIFLTKYIAGVNLAMHPELARDGLFTLAAGTLYGLFSGIFAGRAARLWLLVHRDAPTGTPAFNA